MTEAALPVGLQDLVCSTPSAAEYAYNFMTQNGQEASLCRSSCNLALSLSYITHASAGNNRLHSMQSHTHKTGKILALLFIHTCSMTVSAAGMAWHIQHGQVFIGANSSPHRALPRQFPASLQHTCPC